MATSAQVQGKRIFVLRPYGPRIRVPMFEALGQVGLQPRPDNVISPELDDDQVVDELRGLNADVLLCPYNTLRLADGTTTNGLILIQKVAARLPELAHAKILMPVSLFSAVNFDREWRNGTAVGPVDEALKARVLIIQEQDLKATDELIERLRAHLGL